MFGPRKKIERKQEGAKTSQITLYPHSGKHRRKDLKKRSLSKTETHFFLVVGGLSSTTLGNTPTQKSGTLSQIKTFFISFRVGE